jgi:trigger factor
MTQVKIEKLSGSKVSLSVIIPPEEFEAFRKQALEHLSRDIKIDGFRPGKAPYAMIEEKIGSDKIMAEAAERAVKKSYVDSIVKNKIEAIGEPKITVTKIAPGNNFEYRAEISVLPKITLGNYRKKTKEIKKPSFKEIKAEEIQKEIEVIRGSRAKLITVSREAKKGDRVEIDFQVLIDGKEIPGGTSKNHPLTIGESYFIPGFEEKLTGMKASEEKQFELTFPKDYHKKELAGKPASFNVTMKIVQEKDLPEINDDFAKGLGNFEDLEKLKASIKEGMELEQKKKNGEKWRQDALEKIIADINVEVPDILLEGEIDKMMAEFEQNITSMGMNLEKYLESVKKTQDELRKDWQEPALRRIKAALALQEIAQLENIKPESSEIEEEVNKTLAYFKNQGDMEKNVDMERIYNYTKGVLTNEKVFQFLENL